MNKIILASCLLLLTTIALDAGSGSRCGAVKMPPSRYTKPMLFKPQEILINYWQIDRYCRKLGVRSDGPGRIEACNSRRVVYLPSIGSGGVTKKLQECLREHEDAHLYPNYWPWNHPGAIFK